MHAPTSGAAPAHARRWPSHDRVRRWHFYAGIVCLPFVVWLSLTGAIYLFKPQIEAWLDRPYAQVAEASAPRATPAAQVAAAIRAVPGAVLHLYELPRTATQAVQVVVARDGVEQRVHVHPVTLKVLHVAAEATRPMRIVSDLHGRLLAGDAGSYFVELAASWTIVMLVTGLALWWPRGGGVAGVLYPRLRGGGRRFWRDLHAVTGVWVSGAALFLLVSGLPWTAGWGAYLQLVRTAVEPVPVRQDWATSSRKAGAHADHGGVTMAHDAATPAALDRVVAVARPLGLAAPVVVAPPADSGGAWIVRSDAANRPLRTSLNVDAATGAVLTRTGFAQRRPVDRLVGWGVAIHEGQAFGWVNQLVNLVTAAGLVLLSASSVVLWWRRRPGGMLGAPPALVPRPLARGFGILLIAMGVLLPLFGCSLLVVLGVERLVSGRARRWLGLRG